MLILQGSFWLFAEDSGRLLIATHADHAADIADRASRLEVSLDILGEFSSDQATSDQLDFGSDCVLSLSDLRTAHESWLPAYMSEVS